MERLGRYQVERKLGQGAMGVVLLAQDPNIGRSVAIKTFEVGDAPNEEEWQWLRDRLLLEGNRAGSLDHPNIVKIYDVVDEGDTAYMVMEYVSGSSLDKYLQVQGVLSQDATLRILRQTADALDYAHTRGIIHRDIKPGNLMIDEEGNVKVTDFGIAKRAGTMTQTGRLMGTPEFMAPEQVEGVSEIDGRADQFALATLAYLLLTGQKAFDVGTSATPSQHLASLSHQIVTKQPTAPSQVNPHLGRAVDSVIRKGMSKSPAGRYNSCLEFVEALERATFEVQPQERSRMFIPILAITLVLAALVGVAVYLRKPADEGKPDLKALGVQPPAITFTADKTEIQKGGDARIQWSVQNASKVEIEPEIGPVDAIGSRRVSPDHTTSYEITAVGTQERRTAEVTILVLSAKAPPPPPPAPRVPFGIGAYARDEAIPNQGKIKSGDYLLGQGDLSCVVRGAGSMRIEWFRNGSLQDFSDVTDPKGRAAKVSYSNPVIPGQYEVRLLVGGRIRKSTSFTIEE